MADTRTETPADEMREAAARAREHLLPAVTARVLERDTAVVVICGNHDEPAEICRNCHYFDVQDRVLARLVATLINAREPLAVWLDETAEDMGPEVREVHLGPDETYELVVVDARHEVRSDWTAALAVARVLNGGAQ